MGVQLINIGFGNMAAATRVIAIISPESAPVKRMIQDCRDKGELIDATYGRKNTGSFDYGQWANYSFRCSA